MDSVAGNFRSSLATESSRTGGVTVSDRKRILIFSMLVMVGGMFCTAGRAPAWQLGTAYRSGGAFKRGLRVAMLQWPVEREWR